MEIQRNKICPFEKPRYAVVRLCGGMSIMLTPSCSVAILLDSAEETFGAIERAGDEFVKIKWKDVLITLYRNGSMLFYHLSDRRQAETYATEVLERLGLVSGCCAGNKVNIEAIGETQ